MAETVTMPKLGFDMQEGTLVRWVKSEGENISKGDILAEIETDKATVEVESSASGIVRKLLVDQGAVVPIGAAIAIIGAKDEKVDDYSKAASKPASHEAPLQKAGRPEAPQPAAPIIPLGPEHKAAAAVTEAPRNDGLVKVSPLARKLAREAQVDLRKVDGTGPGGRIVRKDIESALAGGITVAGGQQVGPAYRASAVPSQTFEDQTIPLSRLRQAIARRMTESKTSAPHFYLTHEYHVEALLELREQINALLPEDQKISVNDFIVKAVALNLREFPNLNAAYQGESVLHHGAVNIGVAVAVEGGLLTVVCRDADQKPLREISIELRAMAQRARSGKVHPQDIEGSTFSVSNLGMFDVENFAAILNPPEAGILALGVARQVPVVVNGEINAGWRMKATISVDHRVSDGAEAARFTKSLAKYIEEPLRLLV